MARSISLCSAFPCVLAVAGQAFAADTGMLYVKSNPSGATVVIAGKERGRTPVLVKGLPAGEFTVELRITGVKPVAKQVTVKANRVSTINVTIDVPSASLTVLSDPLEATVLLDDREVGKTPLTLEHLDPGEHRLMLLKDGHPRTARSVVLEPGGERMLEVKLGTAGSDETERPAAGEPVAQAARPVPVEVQLIFTMLKGAVDKGNYGEARRNMALALGQPDMANFKEELSGAIRVVQALEMRQHYVRKGAAKLVGKEVTLKTKTGPRRGKIEGTSIEGIAIASKIMIKGVAAGEMRAVIKWAALAPEEQDRLAESWKPEGPDGAIARAILAQVGEDRAASARALAAAGDHPLGKHLGPGMAVAGAEGGPAHDWDLVEKKIGEKALTVLKELAFERKVAAFMQKHKEADIDQALRRRIRSTRERAKRASGLVAHWTFDEGGGSVVRDWSGRGKHGRIRGARRMKGKIGGALDFDGAGDRVETGRTASELGIGGAGAKSISAWVYTRSFKNAAIFEVGNGARRKFCLRTRSPGVNNWRAEFWNDWLDFDYTSQNQWVLFVLVYDGVTATVWADGSLVRSKSISLDTGGTLPFRISTGFNGVIDDVRIYNRALSAEEVKALAAAAE